MDEAERERRQRIAARKAERLKDAAQNLESLGALQREEEAALQRDAGPALPAATAAAPEPAVADEAPLEIARRREEPSAPSPPLHLRANVSWLRRAFGRHAWIPFAIAIGVFGLSALVDGRGKGKAPHATERAER